MLSDFFDNYFISALGCLFLPFKFIEDMRWFFSSIILFFFFSTQALALPIDSLWHRMSSYDDPKKSYEWTSFIDNLTTELSDSSLFNSGLNFSNLTVHTISKDSTQLIFAGVMPFNNRPSVLIWGVKSADEMTLFQQPLKRSGVVVDLKIEDDSYSVAQKIYHRVNFLSEKGSLLELVDLKLKILFQKLTYSRDDDDKLELSDRIASRLFPLLEAPSLFTNTFSGLEKLSTLISSDGELKICTWNVEFQDGRNIFNGGVAVRDIKKNTIHFNALNDSRNTIGSPERATLSPSKWYGAVYYAMVETEYKKNKYYTLLGYNANNAFSKIRVVDVVTIAGNSRVTFGAPLFAYDKQIKRRVLFEYSARVNMMLRYDAKEKMIVMDHLAPSEPMFKNDPRYYGPDFTYDGFKFQDGKWQFISEVDLRNPAPSRRNQR